MKIIFVTTVSSTMNAFFKTQIEMLVKEGHSVDLACNDTNWPIDTFYKALGCQYHRIDFSRSPLSKGNIKAYGQLSEVIKKGRYDVVHCHTPNASAITRLVCEKFRKKKKLRVFYTAHGFHFYKGAPLKNWLLYYPVEKLCAHFTDVLITINQEDYALAQEKMKAKRIEYVPGVGLDTAKFRDAIADRREKRRELGIPEDAVLLMSVGELNANKNHQIVIRALGQLKDTKLHYAIAGKGQLEDDLLCLAKELGVEENIHLLGFRQDIAQLYKAADICAFPSIREGLGLAALEGMSAGLALIASDNRGTRDYAVHLDNAFLCQHDSAAEFAAAIQHLSEDAALRQKMGEKNLEIVKKFDVEKINTYMKEIYRSVGNEV